MSRHPALLPATSFLAGVAVSYRTPAAGVGVAVAAVLLPALGLALHRCRPRWAVACVCLGLLLTGVWRGSTEWETRTRALEAVLPAGIDVAELHFVGELIDPLETDWNGDRWLRLRGGTEAAGWPSHDPATVLLRVDGGEEATDAALQTGPNRGDLLRVWCRLRRPGPPLRSEAGQVVFVPRPDHDAVGRVKSVRLLETLQSSARRSVPEWVARALGRRLDGALPSRGPERALVLAMLLGERKGLHPDSRRRLRDAGMLHIVAISGLHIGIVVWMLLAVLRRARVPPWARWLLTASLLVGFVQVVGVRPSVVRAGCAAGLLLFGRCVGREGRALNGLFLLAALLVAAEPAFLGQAGFQLTFLATIGLVILTEAIARALPLPDALASSLAVSLAAYGATAPVVASHFSWLAPVGVLSNLVAVPLCAVVLAAGYGTVLLDGVPLVGSVLGALTDASARGLLATADLAAGWRSGAGCALPPSPRFLVVYYACLAIWGAGRRGGLVRWVAVRSALLLAAWLHLGPPPPPASGRTETVMIDVGQGLAIAVRGPEGRQILVDAGGGHDPRFDPGERIVLPHLLREGGRRIEALILTHGHADHAAGAFALLREMEVGQLWIAPGARSSPVLEALSGLALQRGTALVLAEKGRSESVAGVPLRVLAPSRTSGWSPGNEGSVVVLVGRAPARLLVTGDLETAGERSLIAAQAPLRAEALVVGHHGSRGSSSEAFLRQVRPRHALISAGRRNPFGHPHREVLRRLGRLSVVVLRSDESGSVRLVAETEGWRLPAPLNRRRAEPE